jgi:hypothetical protein
MKCGREERGRNHKREKSKKNHNEKSASVVLSFEKTTAQREREKVSEPQRVRVRTLPNKQTTQKN